MKPTRSQLTTRFNLGCVLHFVSNALNKVFSRGVSETCCGKIYDVIKDAKAASVKFNC